MRHAARHRSLTALLALAFAAGLIGAARPSPVQAADSRAQSASADFGAALNADGTFVGGAGVEGAIDMKAWSLVSDISSGEPPRFAPAGTNAVTQAAAWSALPYRIGAISNGMVKAIAVSGSNVYVGGAFTDLAGIATADAIALWNGSSWSALGSNGAGNGAINGEVRAIAITGTSVYVGGSFLDAGGNGGADHVARWTGSGFAALQNFCCGFAAINNLVNDIAIFGDNVYVGGAFTDAGGAGGPDYFARYGITCDCWSAVGSLLNLSSYVTAVAVSDSGTLYIGGAFQNAAGIGAADFAVGWNGFNWFNLGSDGSGDGALESFVYDIAVSGGDVYLGGEFINVAGIATADYVARYNAQSWFAMSSNLAGNGALNGTVFAIAVSGTTVYVGGNFSNAGGVLSADSVARFNGTSWSAMGGSPGIGPLNGGVGALTVGGSVVYVGGGFTDANGNSRADRIASWNQTAGVWGNLGSMLAPDGAFGVQARAAVVSGHTLYVGGYFSNVAGIPEADYVARWDGSNWSAVGSNGSGNGALTDGVIALAVRGGNLYVGGEFLNAANMPTADYVAVWNGSSWSAMGSNGSGNGAITSSVFALLATPTDVFVGGAFSDAAGISTGDRLARWNGSGWLAVGSNGQGDGAFFTGTVATLAMSGGLLYAGGNFVNGGGVATADRVAKWDGSTWSALGSNGAGDGALNAEVVALAARPAGGVYVGGGFTNAAGLAAADYIATWNGSAWSALGPSGSINSQVRAIGVSGSNVYVSGFFTNAGGLATADYVARWNGSAWTALGSNGAGNGALTNVPYAIAMTPSRAYIAGNFANAAGIPQADAVAAWGPLTTYVADGRIKKGSGSYVGNDIYNNDATGQTRTGTAAVNGTVTFTILVQNDGTAASAYRLAATGTSTTKYQVKYFRNSTEITSAVVGGTYQTSSLAPGGTFTITAQVKVLASANVGSSVTRLVTISSVADTGFKDAVKFTVSRS